MTLQKTSFTGFKFHTSQTSVFEPTDVKIFSCQFDLSEIRGFSNIHPASEPGFLPGIFSGGGAKSIVMQIFLLC